MSLGIGTVLFWVKTLGFLYCYLVLNRPIYMHSNSNFFLYNPNLCFTSDPSNSCVCACVQIVLILASVVAIIVYRLAVFFSFSTRLQSDLKELEPFKEYVTAQMATSVTASIISFVVIMVLNILYERVAIWITDFGETPQCQTTGNMWFAIRNYGVSQTAFRQGLIFTQHALARLMQCPKHSAIIP